MAKTKATEREFQGQVISWIKERVNQGGLPFENATQDSSLYGLQQVKFPDVLLTLDIECQIPFCGWELKTPQTDTRDRELLGNAVSKAQTLPSKYFVTWNMQTAIIWRTPEKTRATVNEDDKVQELGPDYRITSVDDVRDKVKAELLRDVCRRLLLDLGRLYENERISLPIADRTIFVGLVANASEKMTQTLLIDINKAKAKKDFDRRLRAWATKQGVSRYDQEYWQTLAQQVAYKTIAKILFYLTLRRQNLHLPKMDLRGDNYKTAMTKMRQLFQLGLEVDYQAIFEPEITDEIELGQTTSETIIELVENLAHWSFELMPLDVIGAVFEKLVPEDARHSLGQYFTPDNLVDLITTFCVRRGDDFVMDPTCGTGTFLIRSYDRLRNLGSRRKPHHQLLNQVWGFDIAGFPAELATINLYRQDFNDYLNFPRVRSQDFFDVMPGESFEFPPPKKTVRMRDRAKVAIPKFDALVGNFPFIRQELIEKVEKGYKKKLEKVLFESWGKDYSVLFNNNTGNSRVKTEHKLRLSGQADIYAYLFFHSAAHLKVGGRMGFVTSNSWLDVAYGYELQRFFLSKFKIIAICESRCEPWFEQSAVNTVFTILERCDDGEEKKNHFVRFVKIKKPLRELFPQNPLTDTQARWNTLDAFVERIEELEDRWKAGIKNGFKRFGPIRAEYVSQPEIISYEDEDARVRMIRQEDLRDEVERAGQTVKWGQYLRGPDIYFEILEKCADKFVPLGKKDVADIRRGITTGINEFFYLTEDKIKHWGIEKEFLKPIVTSTKEIPAIIIDEKKLSTKVFVCDKAEKDLRGTGALRYIRHGEKQTTKKKGKKGNGEVKWPDVPSVQGRKCWYALSENEVSDFLILRFINRRHYTPVNPENIPVGDVVFVGEFKDRIHSEFGCAFLNSVLTALFAEVLGRANLGDGLLTTYGPEIKVLPVPFRNFEKLPKDHLRNALKFFKKLGKRRVQPFEDETKRKDRVEFEKAIFKGLGLSESDYKSVCKAVIDLIEDRYLLPRLRSSRKKNRVEQDIEKLREEVANEVLPNGPIRFPDVFVKGWGRIRCKEIGVPVGLLKLGGAFFEKQEICDEEGNHLMDVGSEEEGKFIIYAKRRNEFVIKIPEGSIAIKKAVQEYEFYLKQLRDKLYSAFMEKCGDHSLSENLTRQVLEEFELPDVR
jgi:type I restriction-modification system DNA methylase subunit